MFKNRFLLNLVLVSVLFAGVLSIIACGPGGGEDDRTAAYDFEINVPEDSAYTFPQPVTGERRRYNNKVIVTDASGLPRQGIEVTFEWHGDAFGGFCEDKDCNTLKTDPFASFDAVTDENGKIEINYMTALFSSLSAEATYTLGYMASSGAVSAKHTDSVTVPATTPPLAISTAAILPDGTVGTVYSTTLTATGGTSPYTWALTSGSLPSGLILSGDSIIGTPTTAATSLFEVTVTDSAATTASVSKTFSLTIVP